MSVKVLNLDRAAGCRPEILTVLARWKVEGTFDITVAEDGGYRFGPAAERVQEIFFKAMLSKARTLKETPHGRRCAVDCHPVGFDPHKDFPSQPIPGMREKFLVWGDFVTKQGLVWGGNWHSFGRDGDLPHAELPFWASKYTFPEGELIGANLKPLRST